MSDTDQNSTMGILSYVILILVVLVILMIFFYSTFQVWKSKSDANLCRQSIEIHSGMNFEGLSTYDDLKCPPKYETFSRESDKEIKQDIANMMAECFWKFGGDDKLELFSGNGMYCALCHHITFEGSAANTDIDEFLKFLTQEPVPIKYGKGISYAEFFAGRKLTKEDLKNINNANKEILTKNDYGVMFTYSKDNDLRNLWTTIIGGGGGVITGIVAGGLFFFPSFGVTQFAAIAVLSAATGVSGSTIGYATGATDVNHQHGVILLPYKAEEIKKLKCTQMPVSQGNK